MTMTNGTTISEECKRCADILIPAIRSALKPHNWAVGVHGSLARDIDLILVAWEENDFHSYIVFDLVMEITRNKFPDAKWIRTESKSFYRTAYSIGLGNGVYLDVSIFDPMWR